MKWKFKRGKQKLKFPKGKLINFPKSKRGQFKLLGKKKWYTDQTSPFLLLKEINYTHWLLAALSGIFMSLSLPPSIEGFQFLRSLVAWFALAPLFYILWSSENIWQSFGKSFLAGLCLNFIGFRFLLGIHPLDWMGVPAHLSLWAAIAGLLVAAVQQAFYWGIYGIFFKLLHKTLGITQWSSLKLSLVWVVWQEKIANAVFLGGIPWTSLYYSQSNNLPLVQIADLVGGSGITFLIIYTNITLAHYFFVLKKSELSEQLMNAISMGLQCAFLFVIFLSYGFFILNLSPKDLNQNTIKALAIQKNLDVSETRFAQAEAGEQVSAFTKLFQKVKGEPFLLLMPEGSLQDAQIEKLWKNIQAISPSTSLMTGAYLFYHSNNTFNTAVAFASGKSQMQIYIKQILVPFGEYTPFEGLFKTILKIFKLEYLAESSFQTGHKSNSFKLPFGNIGPLLCFEAVSPEISNKQIKAGAQALAVLGDASWFRNYQNLVTAQMIAAGQMRAIEGRRYILMDINKGPLASIDKFGRIQAYSRDSEFLFLNFELNKKITFFTKTQW